jgi:hypothetical protein
MAQEEMKDVARCFPIRRGFVYFGPVGTRALTIIIVLYGDKEKTGAPRQPHDRVELERKRVRTLCCRSRLEPSRPALCETISAIDGPRWVRFERDLRGLATVRAHRVVHCTRAPVVAAATAPSAASVFVHSLPTIRSLQGPDGPLTGPRPLKGAPAGRDSAIDGSRSSGDGIDQPRRAAIAARCPPSWRRRSSAAEA